MTQELVKKLEQAAKDGSLPQEENPLYLFGSTSTNLLVKLLGKDINLITLVRLQLRERGVNDKGQWIGFEKASQQIPALLGSKKVTPKPPVKNTNPQQS